MSLKQERKAPFKVFISSTYRDLKEERKKAYEAVGKVCEAIGMEKLLPDDKTTLEVILRELKKSNIYIGIIGSRYGTIVPESQLKTVEGENYKNYEGLSYTHYEFRKAGELGIPRAVFVLDCECRDEQTKKFLEEIDILKSYFNSVDELNEKIEKFLREKIPEWVLEGGLRIPGFYGRKEELRKLYNEITGEEEVCSVVNVYGVGGIGKTAFAEALLFLLSIKGFYVFEVRLEEGREATFNIPDNYKVNTLKIQNLKGLAKLLGIEESENIEDHIISWMEENKVVLFLDDFQEYESNLKDFINKAYKNLKFGKIIIATRAQANVSCHSYVRLTSLEENSCTEMIRKEFERFSFKPEERIVELIYKKTKGHPLAVKMLVSLINRHKLSFNDLDKFGIINDIQNEEEVKDFIKRVFLENVKEEEDLKVLSYLSLLKNGFNYNVLKAILKGLNDERYNWNNGDLYRNFLSKYIDHVLSYDISKEIFNFSHDMVKEAANSQIGNIEEAREEILKMLKGMKFNQISEEEKVLIYEDIIYQAQELRGEESELSNSIIEYFLKALKVSKELTERYYTYAPLMTYEYGCKALAYAEKLEKWIEALEIVEHILSV
jgi:nucleoside-triphosphatase THEP1